MCCPTLSPRQETRKKKEVEVLFCNSSDHISCNADSYRPDTDVTAFFCFFGRLLDYSNMNRHKLFLVGDLTFICLVNIVIL